MPTIANGFVVEDFIEAIEVSGFEKGFDKVAMAGISSISGDCGFEDRFDEVPSDASRKKSSSSEFSTGLSGFSTSIPIERARDPLNPLIIAGKVRPSRFFSTKFFENTCFRGCFESIQILKGTKNFFCFELLT